MEPGEAVFAEMLRPAAAVQGEGALLRLAFRVLDPTLSGRVEISDAFVSDGAGRVNALPGAHLNLRALPDTYALSKSYPNPFNPTTQIPYQLPEAGEVSLVVYNVLGQRVRVRVDGRQDAGYYRVMWDGRDAFGRCAASGVYLVRMAAGGFSQVRKMLLLK